MAPLAAVAATSMTGVVRTTTLIALNCAGPVAVGARVSAQRQRSPTIRTRRKKRCSEYRRVALSLDLKRQKRLLPRDTCTHYRWRRRLDLLSKLTG